MLRGRNTWNILREISSLSNFKKLIGLVFFAVISINGVLNAQVEKQAQKPETLINRRVLIFDFVNANNSADYAYLKTNIPDAFQDSLNKTKSFELMSRSLWQDMLTGQKFQKNVVAKYKRGQYQHAH